MAQREVDSNKYMMLAGLNQGDKVELTDGSVAEFLRLKRKNFDGIIDGQSYNVPINMAVRVLEKADNESKYKEVESLKKGEPFYINKNGNALLFIFEKLEKGRIIGINPISKIVTRIDKSMYAGKVEEI